MLPLLLVLKSTAINCSYGQIKLVQYLEHGIVGCKDIVWQKAVDKWINLLSKSSPINCVHLDKILNDK